MLALALVTILALPPQQEEPGPTPERVELALESLKEAKRAKDANAKIQIIAAHGEIAASKVAKVLATFLRDKDDKVKRRTLEALRWNEDPEALAQLHQRLEKGTFDKHEELLPLLLKAIGQHADESSIPLMSSNAFMTKNRAAVRARILSLGHIRSKASVDALVQLMHSAKREHVQSYMLEIRLSLMILTEQDHGRSQDFWIKWWNKNKKKFKVAEKPPKLPANEDRAWKTYWGYEYEIARDKRRRDRGSDSKKKGR